MEIKGKKQKIGEVPKPRLRTPAQIMAFYLENGGNDLPHYMHMRGERMIELFNKYIPKIEASNPILHNKCQIALRRIS